MKLDTLSMHYTISNPASFGIKKYNITLPCFDESSYMTQALSLENTINRLHSFCADSLSPSESLTCQLLLSQYEQELSSQPFQLYSDPLSPNSGISSQLPILLAEYYFLDKEDVQDYLTLLTCIPDYFSSIENYEKLRAKSGLFMPRNNALKISDQCSSIITAKDITSNSHFLVITFQERIQNLLTHKKISKKEADSFCKQHQSILLHSVLPAYQSLGHTIASLADLSENNDGLVYFPKGRDYYSALLKRNTGSSKSIPEVKELLQNQLRYDYSQLLILSHALQKENLTSDTLSFTIQTPDLMLQDLQKQMASDFPPLPKSTDYLSPEYTVKKVSPCLADYCSPAFYLTPPIDRLEENVIYINQKSISSNLDLYTTLAHEGYPGHLYQTLYFQKYQQTYQSFNPIRSILYYGGYVEGWALYTENLSYNYAKNILSEHNPQNKKYNETLIDYYRYNRDLQLCLYSILDIAIHYDGLQYEEVYSMLAEFGIVDEATVHNIYEYIVSEPTNYLKYYLGYLEILNLKTIAKEKMGTSYNDYLFHEFLLESGPMDFQTLQQELLKKISNWNSPVAYICLKNRFKFVSAFSNTSFSSSFKS